MACFIIGRIVFGHDARAEAAASRAVHIHEKRASCNRTRGGFRLFFILRSARIIVPLAFVSCLEPRIVDDKLRHSYRTKRTVARVLRDVVRYGRAQ